MDNDFPEECSAHSCSCIEMLSRQRCISRRCCAAHIQRHGLAKEKYTEVPLHRESSTNRCLHTNLHNAVAYKFFYAGVLLHRNTCTHTNTLHGDRFLNTQVFSHTWKEVCFETHAFTQKYLYTACFFTQFLSHIQKCLYTQQLLHKEDFTRVIFQTDAITSRGAFAKEGT